MDFNVITFATIAVISLIVEFLTVNLVSIWFVFSGIILVIINLIHPLSFSTSISIFLLLSVLQILLLYDPLVKMFKNTLSPSRTLDKKFIANIQEDKIKYQGVLYSYREVDDKEIKDGDSLEIVGNISTVLLVRKLEKLENLKEEHSKEGR